MHQTSIFNTYKTTSQNQITTLIYLFVKPGYHLDGREAPAASTMVLRKDVMFVNLPEPIRSIYHCAESSK